MATNNSTTTTTSNSVTKSAIPNFSSNVLNYTTKVEDKFVPIVDTKALSSNSFESQFGVVQTQDTSRGYSVEKPIKPTPIKAPDLSITQSDLGFFGEGGSDWLLDTKSKPRNFFEIPSYKAKSLEAMDVMVNIRNKGKVDDSLKAIVGQNKFNEISAFRNRIDITSQRVLNDAAARGNKGEGLYGAEGFVSGSAKNVAIVSDIPAEYISRGMQSVNKLMGIDSSTFRETEQAKSELAAKGKYELSEYARTAGMLQQTFTGYSVFGKAVDKALLATKIPSSAGITGVIAREAQAGLRAQYVNNPKMFNFISNSAQEAIEYGVRKTIDPESTSLGQLMSGVATGGVFSQFSRPGKTLDGIASTRDFNGLSKTVNDLKTKMPDISDEELIYKIKDYKLNDMGMTVGEVSSLIAKRTPDSKIMKTSVESLQDHFAGGGIYISAGGAKRVGQVLDYVNENILKDSKGNKVEDAFTSTAGKGDMIGFKQELVSTLKGQGEANTYASVNEAIESLGKKYGVNIGKDKSDISQMDSIEEALLKPNASMFNLSNPKTLDNLLEQFDHKVDAKVDFDKVYLLDTKIAELNAKTKPSIEQLDNLKAKKIEIEEIYAKFDINPKSNKAVYMLENAVYRVPKGVNGKNRLKYIEGVKAELETLNTNMDSMSNRKSISKEGDVNRIFANQKIASLMGDTSGNHLENIRKANIVMEDIKSGNDSVYFTNAKIREAQYDLTRAKILNELPDIGFYEIADGINLSFKPGEALINGGVVDRFNTPYRVLGNAMGYDSTAFKTFISNPMRAESNWINQGDLMIGDINRMMIDGGLENKDSHKKFSMWMMSRRFDGKPGEVDPRDSMLNAENLRKDNKGNLINTLEWEYKKSKLEKGEVAMPLTRKDIDKYIKEGEALVRNNLKLVKLVSYLDNEFAKNAETFNAIMKEDGQILSPTKNYFPIKKYKVGQDPNDDEIDGVNFDMMRSKFLDSGFLVNIKNAQAPDKFQLELDMGRIMGGYKDNQLYFLHMKPEVDRMSKIIGTSLDETIQISKDNSIKNISGAFGQNMQNYLATHLDNIKSRGTAKVDKTSREINSFVSGTVSFFNLGYNVFSAAAQPLSLVDNAIFHSNTLDAISRTMKTDPNETIAVSGLARQRVTEKLSGLAERKGFDFSNPLKSIGEFVSNKDIQNIGLYGKKWHTSTLDTSLRMMKKVDGATSIVAWNSAFYDKLGKDFPQLKGVGYNLGAIKTRIGDVAFARVASYAEGQMNNIMYQGSSVVNKQQAVAMGTMYSLNTLLMKTMLNRAFLLNDAWRNSSVGKLNQVTLIGMGFAIEEARKYAQQQTSIAVGDKEQYSYYDGLLTKTGDWLTGGKLADTNPEVRIFLNAFGGFVSNYMGGASLGYDPTALFKKSTDAWNFYQDYKDVPTNRKIIGIGEAVVQNLMPGSFKYTVPLAHRDITGEDRFQQKLDDKTLNYMLKKNSEKFSIVNQMSFADQAKLANDKQDTEAIANTIKASSKPMEDAKAAITKEIFSQYGMPTKDEFQDYINKNVAKFRDGGLIKTEDITALFNSFSESDITKEGVDSYSNLPVNAEVIYYKMLKKYLDKKDNKGFINEVNVLKSKGLIKDMAGFTKKVNLFIQKDFPVK